VSFEKPSQWDRSAFPKGYVSRGFDSSGVYPGYFLTPQPRGEMLRNNHLLQYIEQDHDSRNIFFYRSCGIIINMSWRLGHSCIYIPSNKRWTSFGVVLHYPSMASFLFDLRKATSMKVCFSVTPHVYDHCRCWPMCYSLESSHLLDTRFSGSK